MKTVKKAFRVCICIAGLLMTSCSQEESSEQSPVVDMGIQSFTFEMPESTQMPVELIGDDKEETDIDAQTRAYFAETASGWQYVWETGDVFRFYSMRNGTLSQTTTGTFRKTSSANYMDVEFPQPLAEGDIIYSYFDNGECAVAATPVNVTMGIPAEQYSDWGADKYINRQTVNDTITVTDEPVLQTRTFSLTGASLNSTSDSQQGRSTSITPSQRTVTFTINGYSTNLTYTYSVDGTNYNTLAVNSEGQASVDVTFSQVTVSSSSRAVNTSSTVYVRCNNGTAARLTVNASVKRSSSMSGSWNRNYTFTTTYSISNAQSGSYEIAVPQSHQEYSTHYINVESFGTTKILPARNAMPLISRPITVTSAMANGTKSFVSSLSFPMLGSLVEFRLYSTNPDVAVGETIQSVTLIDKDEVPLVGTFTDNLTSSDFLTIQGVTGSTAVISHVENCDLTVAASKASYTPVRMVVAPGMHNIKIVVITEDNAYEREFSGVNFTRANRITVNLDLQKATCTSLTPPTTYSVSSSINNCFFDYQSANEVQEGAPFSAVLMPYLDYEFQEGDITVTMGGTDITRTAVNTANGIISINQVTGDIHITANASPIAQPVYYYVATSMNYCHFTTNVNYILPENSSFVATVAPDASNYEMTRMAVLMGDEDVTEQVYNPTTGRINIPVVTGDIYIKAEATKIPEVYVVTFNAPNCTITGDMEATEGTAYEATIAANEGYQIASVTIMMANDDVTDDFYSNGAISIEEVTGPIVITVSATATVVAAEWETTYAIFTSDRHGSSSYFPSAFTGMSSTLKAEVPYVCMAGDMVGASGGDHPAYNSSTINNEVKSVFANADVQILWADHDASVTDNAGIVQFNGGNGSGLMYAKEDSNGNVQYYVYGIGFYDMKTASQAQTAANNFKNWVSTITDKTIPIITVCHMPIYYQRKDNLGASYWNSALNYAATGSTNGTTVERNVFFIHGHNHTSDNTEYYNPVGSTISVQGTSSSSKANSTIRYTNLTGGYLKTDQAATLFTFEEDEIILTKYKNGTANQLGTVTRVQ